MINLLFSEANFDAKWAYPSVCSYMKKDSRVLVIPVLSGDEWSEDEREWEYHYRKGSRHYEKIMAPFRNYQIHDSQVTWFCPHRETHDGAVMKIRNADIIYLCGNHPDAMMKMVSDLDLHRAFLEFDGVLIGDTYGSAVMMDTYDSAYEWEDEACNGLGLMRGFALESGYVEDVKHLERIIRDIEVEGKAVFGFGKDGGVIIDNGHYELLGNAFTCNDGDLDNIYHAYEDAKSREEYYGDNGLW